MTEQDETIQDEKVEMEYLQMAALDTPDLWSRIEMNLEQEGQTGLETGAGEKTEGTEKKVTDLSEYRKQRSRKPWIGVAAAAVLLLVAVPVWLYFGGSRGRLNGNPETETSNLDNRMAVENAETAEEENGGSDFAAPDVAESSQADLDGTNSVGLDGVQQSENQAEEAESVPEEAEDVDESETETARDMGTISVSGIGNLHYSNGVYYISDYSLMATGDASERDKWADSLTETLQVSNPDQLPSAYQNMKAGDEEKIYFEAVLGEMASEEGCLSVTLTQVSGVESF
jgi:hypothetical protein